MLASGSPLWLCLQNKPYDVHSHEALGFSLDREQIGVSHLQLEQMGPKKDGLAQSHIVVSGSGGGVEN